MNKGVKITLLLLAALILALPAAMAVKTTGHIKLLAVYQEDGGFKGSPADVQLEIKKGEGRVFLETVPLSKVDTQLSTRFAKEMACKFTEIDCSTYDFFYTIKSPAAIVGGPSAGGAIAALTAAMLKNLDVDQETAMTGTINSGNLIGPVGSLKEKIEAAKEAGMKRVIIPAVQEMQEEDNTTNETNVTEYGNTLGIEIVPAATLAEAVYALTGQNFEEEDKEISVPQEYVLVMKEVAEELCNRSNSLLNNVDMSDLSEEKKIIFERVKLFKEANNLSQKGSYAFEQGNYYSAASYCFGASIKSNTLLYEMENLSNEERSQEAAALLKKIDETDRKTEGMDKETITDLQTYMIVKERILEAKQNIAAGKNSSDALAYVEERLNSAIAWSVFFGKGGEKYNLDEEHLKESCSEILGEVDERFQYLNLFFPGLLNDLRNNLLTAHKHYETGQYPICIYLASRTKAEANIIVTMLGVKESYVDSLVQQKIKVAKNAITKQIEKGTFPIIAYSYYEYANSLSEDNKNAALLYSEYALELSDIDIYFQKKKEPSTTATTIKETIKNYLPTVVFIWGMILGVLLAWIVLRERMKTHAGTAHTSLSNRKKYQKKWKTRTRLQLGQ